MKNEIKAKAKQLVTKVLSEKSADFSKNPGARYAGSVNGAIVYSCPPNGEGFSDAVSDGEVFDDVLQDEGLNLMDFERAHFAKFINSNIELVFCGESGVDETSSIDSLFAKGYNKMYAINDGAEVGPTCPTAYIMSKIKVKNPGVENTYSSVQEFKDAIQKDADYTSELKNLLSGSEE